MCNCGCDPSWPLEPPGCVIGGGVYVLNQSYDCTNYWFPTSKGSSGKCLIPSNATLSCVTNSTTKIPGDDSLFMLEHFSGFVNASLAAGKPFFATLQLHTNHIPHPSLPEYYHAYNGTDGRPAGDYLGTLTQMDAAIGALLDLLKAQNLASNTLLWYAADNGPHPGTQDDKAGGIPIKDTATNGLRQCKASVFEGGIRVPGFIHWPAVITGNSRSSTPAYVPDMLPTLLEGVFNTSHPQPAWASDGTSLMPLLRGDTGWVRPSFLAWRLGEQVALLEPRGQYKLVLNPDKGQCPVDPETTYDYKGGLLFDLLADPTESSPITNDPSRMASLLAQASAWQTTISKSQTEESRCLPGPGPSSATALQHTGSGGGCLAATSLEEHAALATDASCSPLTSLNTWMIDASSGVITLNDTKGGGPWCFHRDGKTGCSVGSQVWLGTACGSSIAVRLEAATGYLLQPECPGLCASNSRNGMALANCSSPGVGGWVPLGGGAKGLYLQPFD